MNISISDGATLSKSYYLKSDDSIFVMNSFYFDHDIFTDSFLKLNAFFLAFCGFIIIHSLYMNGRKVNYVTCAVNIQATLGILYSIMFYISYEGDANPTKFTVCYNVIGNGICLLGIQLVDNYFFIEVYSCVAKIPKWKKVLVNLFIYIVLVLPWVPAFLFIPLFYDVNSISFLDVYNKLLLLQLIGAIVYMVYFTLEFSIVLYGFYHNSVIDSHVLRKHKIIATKSILHCFTSIIGNVLYVYIPIFGPLLYSIFIIAGIHFLFNFKIERYYCSSADKSGSNSWNVTPKITPRVAIYSVVSSKNDHKKDNDNDPSINQSGAESKTQFL